MRPLTFLLLAAFIGMVIYLGWEPAKRQLRMMQMERNPEAFTPA
jgi:hypothetical protein